MRYDFEADRFDASPRSSDCSIEDIKQLVELFTSPSGGGGRYSLTNVAYIISFVANSIAAFVGAWRFFRSSDSRSRGLGATIFVLAFTDYIIMAVAVSPTSQASSAILFHEPCNALHITLSTNKGYIDVPGYARGWRAAKGWFSVWLIDAVMIPTEMSISQRFGILCCHRACLYSWLLEQRDIRSALFSR